jgi:hypothetical protein
MYNIGSNVVAYTGTSAANASVANPFTPHTVQRYGGNTLYWDHEQRTAYMALVEDGMTYTPVIAFYLPVASSDNPTTPSAPPSPLDSAASWAREGITSAIAKGFVPADIQGNYTNIITRAEFCRMAVQWVEYATGKSIDTVLAEQGKSRDPGAFTDTSDPYILAAFALGITSGAGGGLFNPSGQFNREQAATMIMNTARAIGANVADPPASDFGDMSAAAGWAQNGINFVGANGIMSGSGGNFNPKGTFDRQQSIVTFNNIKHNEKMLQIIGNIWNIFCLSASNEMLIRDNPSLIPLVDADSDSLHFAAISTSLCFFSSSSAQASPKKICARLYKTACASYNGA